MSKRFLGKPPSRRDGHRSDWRERLDVTTRSLATKMRDTFEFDDPTTRRQLIAGVRLALGESPMVDLESGSNSDDEAESAIAVIAQAYRLILEGDGISRDDPYIAESFMSIVERALDDMGLGWRTKVRKMTDMVIAIVRTLGTPDAATIRAEVMEIAREATDAGRDDDYAVMILPAEDDDDTEPTPVTTPRGAFRLLIDVYSIDCTSESSTRTFLDVVESRVVEVLADAD